jgi:glycosyltransferase involved in cell wall biosynthesis
MYNIHKKSKVSIGLPVYNGEKFIEKRIKSITSQTFKDFELIISDNSSTDMTSIICQNYAKADNRIKFFRQSKNIGAVANFNFVLQESKGDYFMWAAVDDVILPTFIERNLQILEKNSNIVCSISKMKLFGETTDYLKLKSDDSIITKLFKQIKTGIGHLDTYAASGPYEKRIQEYLKNLRHNQIFYGIYRTDLIKKSHVQNHFLGVEACTILNLLKFGELHVVDEILLYVYDGGVSRKGMIEVTRHMHHGILGTILPHYSFTLWCMKNLDKKIFLMNIDFFIRINGIGIFSLFVDLLRRLGNITKNEKHE